MASAVECVYAVEGHGPPLIMVHGIGARKENWSGVSDGLKDHFTCITFDLRGHGQSPLAEQRFGLDDLVADVESVRSRLGIEKAHIIGHSLGGMIAPAYARAYPERVGALGLLSTAAFRPAESRVVVDQMRHSLETLGMGALIDGWLGLWFTDEFMVLNPEIVARRKKQALDTDPVAFRSVFDIFNLTEMSPWLHEITAPALALTGEFDAGCNPIMNKKIVEAMPNAELVILDGLKHALTLEAPQRLSQPVRDFLLAHPF